ncbi:Nif11-like leader peptide family natural product precursor [Phormidium tenue FACHB-886]|nr:Nif11-like leader peptide family natural product precursor [Phormidium tenue FACHB-886]
MKDSMLQERLKSATDPESLSELDVELAKEKDYFFTEEEVLVAMAAEAAMGDKYVEEKLFAEALASNCPLLNSFCTQNNNSSSEFSYPLVTSFLRITAIH